MAFSLRTDSVGDDDWFSSRYGVIAPEFYVHMGDREVATTQMAASLPS